MSTVTTFCGKTDWGECQRCGLAGTRRRVAIRRDEPAFRRRTHILFIGEAPGKTEDALGEPFVGESGRIFKLILEELNHQCPVSFSYTITNIVGCRPPDNRQPLPPEIEACKPHIDELVETLTPTGIAYLGKVAKAYKIKLPVVNLVHPAFILRKEYKLLPIIREAHKLANFLEYLETLHFKEKP